MGPRPPARAFIFDMDGVVIDSMPVHEQAWERYLDSMGIRGRDADEIRARMHGRRNDEIVRDILGPAAPAQDIHRHGAAKEQLFRDMVGEEVHQHLVPGIGELLERTHGIPVALATNAERANADFVLDGSGLRRYFQVVVDGSQVPHPKPAPDVYLLAARQLGVAPADCIVFEDSPVGVASARSAGTRVVGILTHADHLDGVEFAVRDFEDPALQPWLARQLPAPLPE